ncbi:biofilm regulation phosphoprotein SiaC [Oceanimonas sp. CHS3-5]|uniref:biofilm regulation phosphoprotein SiaC n=1 Tax=Oceanimonas sp. CHS3-5 TaxID=3068186 RepID=UPI00273F69D2|nr:biofilm regulation phosphoprotein SiaC [Oceanimonas sp. CHS3-5]MDP5292587.1 biofilm regulation phosphoprotein SiaC [Oceanimonas sp. CHS3-5]
MNTLAITGTHSTPDIMCDPAQGTVIMKGDSYPENSFEFFHEVINWIEQYLDTGAGALRLELHLVYMNTSSVKAMMDIFDLLEAAFEKQRQVVVQWFFDPDNERVEELAEEFREDCSFPFEVLPHG